MSSIDLIIFDLGRVLVDFDFKKVVRDLQRYSSMNEQQIRDYFATTALWDQFERGHVDSATFFQALKKDLMLKDLTFEGFTPLWNDIFTEKAECVEIVQQLRGRFRLAMISNVNPMHWEHVKRQHPFMEWFEHPMASYVVGFRKPEQEIFHLMLQQTGVPASRAVFIDDVLSHVEAARLVGIRSHQFIDAATLRKDLSGILK